MARYDYIYKVPLRDVVYLKSGGCRKLQRGNTGVPVLRACTSLLLQHHIPILLIVTVYDHTPGNTLGASNNLSPGVLILWGGDTQRTYPGGKVGDFFGI